MPTTDSSSWDSSRCPTCGRAHPLRTDATFEWFGDNGVDQVELESTDGADGPTGPTLEPDGAVVSDAAIDLNQAPRWLPAGLVVAAVAGLAALIIFAGGPDTVEPAAEPPTAVAAEPTPDAPTAVPTPDADELAAVEAETQRQRHEVASIWARTLVPAAASAQVVYRTENRVALVDLGAGEQTELRLDVPIDLATEGFGYLASERGTWVINPATPEAALRLAPQAEIAPLADPTASIVVPEPGARFIMLSQHDGRIVRPIVEVPPGSDVLVVGGRGAIVTPPAGGSTLVSALGAEALTTGRVLAANADFLIELRCEPLRCRALVRSWPSLASSGDLAGAEEPAASAEDSDASAEEPGADASAGESGDESSDELASSSEIELPPDIWSSANLELAPNGAWLFVSHLDAETWQLFDLRDGVADLAASGNDPSPKPSTAVAWSPDSSYFVFVDDDGLVFGSPEEPKMLAKVPLQFGAAAELRSSEMMVLPG